MGRVMDGERSTQTGLEGQVLGTVSRGPGLLGPLGKGAPLSGALVAREPLSRVCRRPWFRRQTGLLRNHRELGNRRKGSWPGTLGTRNVKPPGLPHGTSTQFRSKARLVD